MPSGDIGPSVNVVLGTWPDGGYKTRQLCALVWSIGTGTEPTDNTYWDWYSRHIFLFGKAATYVTLFAQTFQEFPQRQKPETWNVDQILQRFMPE